MAAVTTRNTTSPTQHPGSCQVLLISHPSTKPAVAIQISFILTPAFMMARWVGKRIASSPTEAGARGGAAAPWHDEAVLGSARSPRAAPDETPGLGEDLVLRRGGALLPAGRGGVARPPRVGSPVLHPRARTPGYGQRSSPRVDQPSRAKAAGRMAPGAAAGPPQDPERAHPPALPASGRGRRVRGRKPR